MPNVFNAKFAGCIYLIILVSSALRADLVSVDSDFGILYPSWVSTIHFYSMWAFAFASLLSLKPLFLKEKLNLRLSLSFLFITVFSIYYILIQYIYMGLSARLFLAIIIIFFYFYLYCFFLNSYFKNDFSIIYDYLYKASIFVVILNFILFIVDSDAVTWQGRFYGLHTHPNFLAVICAILINLSLNKTIRTKNVFNFIFLLIAFYILILTGSRTGLIASIFGILVTIFINFDKYSKKTLAIFSVFLVIFFWGVGYLLSIESDEFRYNRFVSNDDTRSELWNHMWRTFLERPIFGNGNGMGTANSYLRVLSDTGVLGFIIFFFAIFPVLINSLKILLNSSLRKSDIANYIPLAVVILVAAITEGFLLDFNSFSVLCFYLILSVLGMKLK